MTNIIMGRVLNAGNSHVRFDAGDVASAKPGSGSRFCKRFRSTLTMAVAVLALVCTRAWATDVDVGSGGYDYRLYHVGGDNMCADCLGETLGYEGVTYDVPLALKSIEKSWTESLDLVLAASPLADATGASVSCTAKYVPKTAKAVGRLRTAVA